jgi:hypothetical protein
LLESLNHLPADGMAQAEEEEDVLVVDEEEVVDEGEVAMVLVEVATVTLEAVAIIVIDLIKNFLRSN